MLRALPSFARKSGRPNTPLGQTHNASARYHIKERAALLGVRLTREEASLLRSRATRLLGNSRAKREGQLTREEFNVSRRKFLKFARSRQDLEMEREAMLATIEQPEDTNSIAKHFIPVIGIIGTLSWSIAGTQAAGEAGMHIIGCSLVGCISALGGGTVNNLLFGDAKQGVNWVRNPHTTVMVALLASIVTFFTWPLICHALAEQHLQRIRDIAAKHDWLEWTKQKLGIHGDPEGISKLQFLNACDDTDFYREMSELMPQRLQRSKMSAEQIFNIIDREGTGFLNLRDLEHLVKMQYDGSTLRYVLDTISVSTSSVTGTAGAISRGLHPLVCVASSVTLCFGGILRDLICHREVALGSQSFAACTSAGSAIYVLLRELNVRGYGLSLGLRIVLAGGTTAALRFISFHRGGALLAPMHGEE